MKKHTPLPWKVYARLNVYDEGKKEFVASCGVNGRELEINEANTQFIATACNSHYELLEACKEGLAFIWQVRDDLPFNVSTQIPERIHQAIAKAERGKDDD